MSGKWLPGKEIIIISTKLGSTWKINLNRPIRKRNAGKCLQYKKEDPETDKKNYVKSMCRHDNLITVQESNVEQRIYVRPLVLSCSVGLPSHSSGYRTLSYVVIQLTASLSSFLHVHGDLVGKVTISQARRILIDKSAPAAPGKMKKRKCGREEVESGKWMKIQSDITVKQGRTIKLCH